MEHQGSKKKQLVQDLKAIAEGKYGVNGGSEGIIDITDNQSAAQQSRN